MGNDTGRIGSGALDADQRHFSAREVLILYVDDDYGALAHGASPV
jgi:hypothetical protein